MYVNLELVDNANNCLLLASYEKRGNEQKTGLYQFKIAIRHFLRFRKWNKLLELIN